MKRSIADVIATKPDLATVVGWGEVRLSPLLFRDLTLLAARRCESVKYAYAVDVDTANFLNNDDSNVLSLEGEYRPSRQDGTRIGAYRGADMHVIDSKIEKHCLILMCLDDDDNVIHQETSLLKAPEFQINHVPVVTPENLKALNGKFHD
jgi:hypothetical protein